MAVDENDPRPTSKRTQANQCRTMFLERTTPRYAATTSITRRGFSRAETMALAARLMSVGGAPDVASGATAAPAVLVMSVSLSVSLSVSVSVVTSMVSSSARWSAAVSSTRAASKRSSRGVRP